MEYIYAIQNAQNAHELFNDYYFKGQLNTPIIIVDIELFVPDVGAVWGYYEAISNTIALTYNPDIYCTLLHEMIHQYQQEFNLIDKNHGTTFRKWTRFLEFDLGLERGEI